MVHCLRNQSTFRAKCSNKLILVQNSEIYTHTAPGLLNINKLLHTDVNSLTTLT